MSIGSSGPWSLCSTRWVPRELGEVEKFRWERGVVVQVHRRSSRDTEEEVDGSDDDDGEGPAKSGLAVRRSAVLLLVTMLCMVCLVCGCEGE